VTATSDAGTRIALRAEIARETPSLPPAQARLATFLLDNFDAASDYTITELAGAAEVSIGTVSQLARRFNLKGYQELRFALAREAVLSSVGASLGGLRPDEFGDADPVLAAVDRVLAANSLAIAETRRTIDLDALRRAVELLQSATQIVCVGAGSAAFIAGEGALKLRKLGLPAFAPADSHAQAMAAANLRPTDALMAISHSGRTTDTIHCAEVARARGAAVIAVTGPGRSPLAGRSDVVIETVSYDRGFQVEPMASAVAELSVVQVLFVLLLERGGRPAEEALSRTQWATEGKHVRGKFG
jgi:DNA-binding MurR/RpiR family transcriptional regulator